MTLSDATSGATIRYTTDGSTPTASSPVYTGPIAVTQSRTIRAIAMKSGMLNSAVASATYTVQTATPTFNPPGGTYLLNLTVSISGATPGATIYYTTDGSTPTTSSTRLHRSDPAPPAHDDHDQGDCRRSGAVAERGRQRDLQDCAVTDSGAGIG